MPLPLSSLTDVEQRLYASLARDPLDPYMPLVLADAVEEHGHQDHAELLRRHSRLALLEILRGRCLTDQECAQTAARITALLAPPAAQQQPTSTEAMVEREFSAALGAPRPREDMLRLLDGDGRTDSTWVRDQLDFQRTLLASLDLPIGPDHYVEILDGLSAPHCQEALRQGQTLLLLTPRIPFADAVAAFGRGLRRSAHLLTPDGELAEPPVYVHPHVIEEGLLYHPASFTPNGGGRTEEQWMADAGQDFLLLAPSAEGLESDRNRSATEALRDHRPHEVFLTPQGWMWLFLTLLELRGQVMDRECSLPGACLASSRSVPFGSWHPERRQADLLWRYPEIRNVHGGVRAAVRVL